MTIRRPVRIAFALAVGMALGYAVRPAAQGSPATPKLGDNLQLLVEPAGGDRVRVVLPTGGTIEDSHFELVLTPGFLMVRATPTTTFQRPAGVVAPPNAEPAKGYILPVPKR